MRISNYRIGACPGIAFAAMCVLIATVGVRNVSIALPHQMAFN